MSAAEILNPGRLIGLVVLVFLGMAAIFLEAAPFGVGPMARPSPDLLLCVVAYWSLRRPDAAPMLAIFVLGLLRDLLTDVPVGAGALILVVVSEVLKNARRTLHRGGFGAEWAAITGAAFASTAALWAVVFLTLAQPPYLSSLFYQCLFTALAYPAVVLVFRWLLRIRWQRPEPVR